jgi:membrane-associated phospholipid phosphatase
MAEVDVVDAGAIRRRSAAAAAAGLLVLLVSALPVEASTVGRLELDVFRAVNDLPGALFPVLWPLMQFGAVLIVPATALAAVAFRRYRLAGEVLAAGVAAWLLAKVVKEIVFRERPAAILDDVNLHGASAAGRGFVSGHAAIVFALAVLVTPHLPRRWRWAPWAVAVTVAFARVYVGAHFPLDVVGGAGLGLVLGGLARFGGSLMR